MSTIDSDIYSALGQTANTNTTTKKSDSLGQADFLRLMTEQRKYQDPLNPMQNSEFLGQLAQFSTVQGIQGLQSTMKASPRRWRPTRCCAVRRWWAATC